MCDDNVNYPKYMLFVEMAAKWKDILEKKCLDAT